MTRPFLQFSRWAPIALLTLMAAGSLVGLFGDSPTIDERAHLPAGYSYVTRGDMRLNPEHPPLLKDLAGISAWLGTTITGTRVVFPDHLASWNTDTNGQWQFGSQFLFDFNEIRPLLYWGRLPTLLILLGFGWFLYWWVKKTFGAAPALVTVALYALSPTLLGHGHYVTTDVPAAAAFFLGLIALCNWIVRPARRTFWIAVLAVGIGLLTKFSLLLLLPVGAVLLVVWNVYRWNGWKQLLKRTAMYGVLLVTAVSLVVAPVYALHVQNYPVDKQVHDIPRLLPDDEDQPIVEHLQSLAGVPVLRGVVHYATGVLMVRDRTLTAGQVYFQGAIHPHGQASYFPLLYLFKEPLTYHALSLVAFGAWLGRRRKRIERSELGPRQFFLIGSALLTIVYWYTSVRSDLNIGLRHVLPSFPFLFLLTAVGLTALIQRLAEHRQRIAWAIVGGVLVAQCVSVAAVTPSYIAYFNAAAGGTPNGWKIAADSNYDWGQDYWRLVDFVRERKIDKIAIDYFGDVRFAKDMPGVAEPYHVEYGPIHGWLAISWEYLSFEQAPGAHGLNKQENRYAWLNAHTPVARVGQSIVVYYIP